MALKALAQQRTKSAVKTLSELLAAVFTASTLATYEGIFLAENFIYKDNTIIYEAQDDYEDDNHYVKPDDGYFVGSFEFSQPFETNASHYCCGLLEIGNFESRDFPLTKDPAINAALMRVFLAAIKTQFNMVMATTIASQKTPTTALVEAGFLAVAEYQSKGTGAMITVFMKDLSEKELLPGGLELENWETFN